LRSAEGTPRAGAMNVALRATGELSEADHQERQQLSMRVNGPPEARSGSTAGRLTWAGIDDTLCAVTVRHEGRLVSSLFVNARTILVNERAVYAGGIRAVMTDPAYRRRGFARAALERAHQYMWQDLQVQLGLLLSSAMAVPLYASLGWQIFDGTVLCQQPGGTLNYTECNPGHPPMLLLPGHAPPFSGVIDMCGLPW
jgi:GNAT superfamily N-acetyltransferase